MNTALTSHLHDYFGVDVNIDPANHTTLLRQATLAQEWLIKSYLTSWLELLGGTLGCDYPLASKNAINLRAVSNLREMLDPAAGAGQLGFVLNSIERNLRHLATLVQVPEDRGLQWGVWARDVPMSIAYACAEQKFLDGSVCRDVASCCMYAALVVSQIVTDAGVAEEIAARMFEEMPRELLAILSATPVAPEA